MSIIPRVIDAIGHQLSYELPKTGAVAAKLNMSARTLSRKLNREGTTFKKLSTHHLLYLSMDYLESGEYSVDDISYMVGYSYVYHYRRAFYRWKGCTPSEYLKLKTVNQD